MTLLETAGSVVTIFIFGFTVAGIIVAVPLFRLINRLKFLTEILTGSLIPVIEKLDTMVTNLDTGIIRT